MATALAEHLNRVPALAVELAWQEIGSDSRPHELLFSTTKHRPINRNTYNDRVWKPALVAADIAPTRGHGMHACRHHFASVLLDGGVSVRALADYLSHADPGFTLRVYSHLMPETEDRARAAIDAAHAAAADSLRTGPLRL